jgi:hypothetical protein
MIFFEKKSEKKLAGKKKGCTFAAVFAPEERGRERRFFESLRPAQ